MADYRDLSDGEVELVQGSAAKPYEVKNMGGIYSCSCPAWRNQSRTIDKRTCKHIRGIRGAEAETARLGTEVAPAPKATASTNAPVLLAQKWEPHVDLTGWWLSEKLDGVRAYWDGTTLMSRLGNQFFAPDWFREALGPDPLDGELWTGRGEFQETVSIVRSGDRHKEWRRIKFLMFDRPAMGGPFEERIDALKTAFNDAAEHLEVVAHYVCEGHDHLTSELARVEGLGGEGLMARKPKSLYVPSRSSTLLKIKTFKDDEAIVIGHVPGKGRHKGRLGALEARLKSGVTFNVGTGFSDAQRENPPPIGSIIHVRFQELTRDGVPRFPSYFGVRDDVAWTGATTSPSKSAPKSPAKSAAKTAVKVAAKPAVPPAERPAAGVRRFEFVGGTSNKFWEVWTEGENYTVRYGRIGANGTTKTKAAASADAAQAAADKLIRSKVGKGYEEV